MTDIVIYVERKRYDDKHWIRPAPPTGNTEQQYRVWFEGVGIGSWRVPECSAARWLLANGKAERTDTLRSFWRGRDVLCLTGSVGWLADHTVTESDKQGGTPRFIKWKPMPEGVRALSGGGVKPASEENSDAE
jgi:hypothetical protein